MTLRNVGSISPLFINRNCIKCGKKHGEYHTLYQHARVKHLTLLNTSYHVFFRIWLQIAKNSHGDKIFLITENCFFFKKFFFNLLLLETFSELGRFFNIFGNICIIINLIGQLDFWSVLFFHLFHFIYIETICFISFTKHNKLIGYLQHLNNHLRSNPHLEHFILFCQKVIFDIYRQYNCYAYQIKYAMGYPSTFCISVAFH